MSTPAERRSPVRHLLEARGAEWGRLGDTPVALRLGPPEAEAEAVRSLALCDLSALAKLGVRGPGAAAWLSGQGVDVPPATYDTRPLAGGGLIARLGAADFLLEGGFSGVSISELSASLASVPRAYRAERADATFLLAGSRAAEVLAQLCSIDFRAALPGRVVLTRAAGVNCGVLPDLVRAAPGFRLWVDPGYAVYFWETLAGIGEELGGRVVGAAALYPDQIAGPGL